MWRSPAGNSPRGWYLNDHLYCLRQSKSAQPQFLHALWTSTLPSLKPAQEANRFLAREALAPGTARRQDEELFWRLDRLCLLGYRGALIFICTRIWAMAQPARPESLPRLSGGGWM